MSRLKTQLASQLEEARRTADEEARERQAAVAQAKNYQHEAEQLRESIEDELESKNEVLRQLSKANAEIQQWKTRFEGEGLLKADELEDAKRRQQQKINELTEGLDAANSKIASLDKTRSRLVNDLDDAQVGPSFYIFSKKFEITFIAYLLCKCKLFLGRCRTGQWLRKPTGKETERIRQNY